MSIVSPANSAIKEVQNITSPIKFFVYMHLVLIAFIIGLTGCWSKIEKPLEEGLVVNLIYLFFIFFIGTILLVTIWPKRYLYTRVEWLERDRYNDSKSRDKYDPNSKVEENTTAFPTEE